VFKEKKTDLVTQEKPVLGKKGQNGVRAAAVGKNLVQGGKKGKERARGKGE